MLLLLRDKFAAGETSIPSNEPSSCWSLLRCDALLSVKLNPKLDMEPVSIVMMANASFAIARSLVHTIKELYEIAEAYETAALGIRTVATQCDSFRIAIQRINKWLEKQNEDSKHDLDEDFWRALQGNIETARLVLEDLEKRIQGLRKNSAKFWIRTKYLWNGVVIAELQSQIQGLMAAVSILLQVIDM